MTGLPASVGCDGRASSAGPPAAARRRPSRRRRSEPSTVRVRVNPQHLRRRPRSADILRLEQVRNRLPAGGSGISPCALARSRPSPVRVRIKSLSNSASPPRTVSIKRPCAVVVSAHALKGSRRYAFAPSAVTASPPMANGPPPRTSARLQAEVSWPISAGTCFMGTLMNSMGPNLMLVNSPRTPDLRGGGSGAPP